jgi:lipase chaperone LimK
VTNKEEVFDLINNHPEGLDDDDIAAMTGIQPRQQVQQLCNQLADSKRIRRQSVGKAGKRRKIHNFPTADSEETAGPVAPLDSQPETWRRRLSALVAATGRTEADLLEESVQLLAMKVLRQDHLQRDSREDAIQG